MDNPGEQKSETPSAPASAPAGASATHSDHHPEGSAAKPRSHPVRKWLLIHMAIAAVAVAGYFMYPAVVTMLNTESTDDAYVNGHVTLVAPRVIGQVTRVLVDDNYRVKQGELLVQLDKEPYQVQVAIKRAEVEAAKADLVSAEAQVRGLEATGISQRWQLQSAMEQVANQIANLRANVAAYESKKAMLALAEANYERGKELAPSGGISKEDLDVRRRTVEVDRAGVKQALEVVHASRVYLGLSPEPPDGKDLTYVPPELVQSFSGVRTAQYSLVQTMAQIGLPLASASATPEQLLEDFRKRDVNKDVDRVFEKILPDAPAVKVAKAKLMQANSDLDQALLNLRYCDIISEIDGVVTRRNVNPGNNVAVGQSLMAVRSLTEIWIDCNFKETQLAELRIGHRVVCEVDMYGSRREYEGRITGFTMGTGQTLSLLPPQNATGNFVKIVQRLPVRVELTDYDPEKVPLFVGLSVVPYVYYKEKPTGPNAGDVLQPLRQRRKGPWKAVSRQDNEHPRREPNCRPAPGDQPLVCRRGRGHSHVHGGAGHHHRQRGATVHRRWLVGVERRQRVGHHQLPCGKRHHLADLGLDFGASRAPQLLSAFDCRLHDRIGTLRHGHQLGTTHPLPRDSGLGRRRTSAVEPGRAARCLSAGKAGRCADDVRHRGPSAPVVGPTLGGYLTVNYNWRWIFYINVPVARSASSRRTSWSMIQTT